jgi:hypothetical protein
VGPDGLEANDADGRREVQIRTPWNKLIYFITVHLAPGPCYVVCRRFAVNKPKLRESESNWKCPESRIGSAVTVCTL